MAARISKQGPPKTVPHRAGAGHGYSASLAWASVAGWPRTASIASRVLSSASGHRCLAAYPAGADGFVFTDNGKPVRRTAFSAKVWRPAVAEAGLSGVGFHDLRHYFASLLIRHGESVPTVQARMGHACVKVTISSHPTETLGDTLMLRKTVLGGVAATALAAGTLVTAAPASADVRTGNCSGFVEHRADYRMVLREVDRGDDDRNRLRTVFAINGQRDYWVWRVTIKRGGNVVHRDAKAANGWGNVRFAKRFRGDDDALVTVVARTEYGERCARGMRLDD
jgi:integrase-like protein